FEMFDITGESIFDDCIVKIETYMYNPFANTTLIALNAGWNSRSDTEEDFNFCVPLSMLLGFCEDYKRLIVNARHELILIRARNNNCLVRNPVTESEVELFKVQWRMPHVALNEVNKLSMLRALESGHYLSMSFRSWDLYKYPLLQNTTQLEKSRYVIFAADRLLANHRFTSFAEIENWLQNWITSKDESFFRDEMRNLSERWEKVVASDGQYFN
ncbi:MOS1T transposase, partial [Pseudoatta argentina]